MKSTENRTVWIPDSKTPSGIAEVSLTEIAPMLFAVRLRFQTPALTWSLSTCATRLSAGGVADEWVTQLLRQGEAKVFKKYSQMKRKALATILGFQ
jgi:hypothetical protein